MMRDAKILCHFVFSQREEAKFVQKDAANSCSIEIEKMGLLKERARHCSKHELFVHFMSRSE